MLLVGSVSVGVWQMACRRVIKVGERVVKDLASEPMIHTSSSENPLSNYVPSVVSTS